MSTDTTSAATAYEQARQPLTAVIESVPADAWASPSPCEGWSARDVVRHMVETQRELFAGQGVDLGPAPDVDADPAAAWRDHAKRVEEVTGDESVAGIEYDGHFGPTTLGRTLEQFYVWDMLVHRWDLARATGVGTAFSDAELDRIEGGADSFGEAIYMDGICRPGVEAPEDADRTTRVLARLGRSA